MRLTHPDSRIRKKSIERIAEDAKNESITLILGAGVSLPYRIPSWDDLVSEMWQQAYKVKAPWHNANHRNKMLGSMLSVALELIQKKTGRKFLSLLHETLYKNVRKIYLHKLISKKTSLEIIADIIISQYEKKKSSRNLRRIITFNIDDLLEKIVRKKSTGKPRTIKSIGRSCDNLFDAVNQRNHPVPVYHLHGFIPEDITGTIGEISLNRYLHNLVFTDSQYWQSSGTMLSFANRVMGEALHDSHCVFIGCSMLDENIRRWLALRYNEFVKDNIERILNKSSNSGTTIKSLYFPGFDWRIKQHYWIRTAEMDFDGLLSEFFEIRGISPIVIPSWHSVDFYNIMNNCFRLS